MRSSSTPQLSLLSFCLQISDPTKLKKMSKRQLRNVKRVRIDDEGVPTLAPAYS